MPLTLSGYQYGTLRDMEPPAINTAILMTSASKCLSPPIPQYGFEKAVPGSIRLAPQMELREVIERDYQAMQGMILGDPPDFEWVTDRNYSGTPGSVCLRV